jgi:hypothetical protein
LLSIRANALLKIKHQRIDESRFVRAFARTINDCLPDSIIRNWNGFKKIGGIFVLKAAKQMLLIAV